MRTLYNPHGLDLRCPVHAGEMVAAGDSMAMNDAYITVFEAMTKPMVAMETWSYPASISPSRLQ